MVKKISSNEYYLNLSKKLLPGGNSLLSKRSEMFSPSSWPGYFKSASGISVTDLNENQYKDFTHFSAGTCVLGYSHSEVNEAAISAIRAGNMSTLNSYEEVELAAKLTGMHKGLSMAKFARTGGEANAMAVRLARNLTKKNKIAFCGYHGWHDWYLSANLADENNLNQQLMSGLSASGVPQNLTGSSIPFTFGDLTGLRQILLAGDVAAVKVETVRSVYPTDDYLTDLRNLCDEFGALLIFDECTSGFRETFGAIYTRYDVVPDLVILGKTLGNGFPITTVLGSDDVMNAAQTTFVSSTFFTERVGFAAALKTLEVMEREKTWETLTDLGSHFKRALSDVFDGSSISITQSGMNALPVWSYNDDENNIIKTLITEKMLLQGYLFGAAFYPSSAHTKNDIDDCCAALGLVLNDIEELIMKRENLKDYLQGPPAHSGFQRLN